MQPGSILPIATIGLIVGLPVLAFAPLLAFCTSVKLIRAWAGFAGKRSVAGGAAGALAALVWLGLPAIQLRAAYRMIHSRNAWLRDKGFDMLRFEHLRVALVQTCYGRQSWGADQALAILAGRGSLAQEEAHRLYYQVWGKAFDSEPFQRPEQRGLVSFRAFDSGRGGSRVGPSVEGVRLSASRIDGSLDARSAIAYLEWTFVFHNKSATQQEARMELALPPDGVVSRATLWIHGVERKAAFGERGQVRAAYESVVHVRRDPLLVTSSGRDRVMVQCFPIEPNGEMKVRIGITAPIVPEQVSDRGVLGLPALIGRNFDPGGNSSVWLESRGEFVPADRFKSRRAKTASE